jgi:hypothetical protein
MREMHNLYRGNVVAAHDLAIARRVLTELLNARTENISIRVYSRRIVHLPRRPHRSL